jgi:uncharacterized membrane protein
VLTDLTILLQWWLVLAILGFAGWPLTRMLFGKWENKGYLLAKAIGLLTVTYGVWLWGSFGLLPFGWLSIFLSGVLVAGAGWIILKTYARDRFAVDWKSVIIEEAFFLAALTFWAWIKAHEPTINGLEKFMDYGFTRSILREGYFPPADMWFAGEKINYYYFGHLVMAVITKLSGIDLAYGFNLMLATLFALCSTMSFAIGRHLLEKLPRLTKLAGAFFIAFLVTLSGNLHTIYAFTSGYWGEDNPPPFWKIFSPIFDAEKFKEGWNNYWYPNATRFIPYTIHEFPSYSFVVSDIHGHVLAIPIALLLIALVVVMFIDSGEKESMWKFGVYGAIAGAAFMTNALDGPIYLALFFLLLLHKNVKFPIKNMKFLNKLLVPLFIAGGIFLLTVTPFLLNFKPFVSGIAINCPPAKLAGTKIGPFIFEETEKCQKSPLWMMLVLWGFFLYCGLGLTYLADKKGPHRPVLLIWSGFCLALIIFPEFFYFKDIYPLHFRSNTMFKLGYQVFIIMSIVSGYTIISLTTQKAKSLAMKIFLVVLIPLVGLVSIYPWFAVRSYFNQLKDYQGLYGLGWMRQRYPDDFAAVNWLNTNVPDGQQPVILEAAGDSYTDYERISAFTGLPTVAGWAVHEWLWRGSYQPIGARGEEVRYIYESPDIVTTADLLKKYQVQYIVIGNMERDKYPDIDEDKITQLARPVFSQGTTSIYQVLN